MAFNRSRSMNSAATGLGCPGANRASTSANSALRLRSPVRSSCSARSTQLLLRLDACLNLSEQRGDRHQRVEFRDAPFALAVLDETEDASGDVTGQQRRAHHRGGRHVSRGRAGALVVLGLGPNHRRFGEVLGEGEQGIGEVDQLERIRFLAPDGLCAAATSRSAEWHEFGGRGGAGS